MSSGGLFVVLQEYVVLLLPCSIGTELGGRAGLSKHRWSWSTPVHLGHNPHILKTTVSISRTALHVSLLK